jgi:hypothetical protein
LLLGSFHAWVGPEADLGDRELQGRAWEVLKVRGRQVNRQRSTSSS